MLTIFVSESPLDSWRTRDKSDNQVVIKFQTRLTQTPFTYKGFSIDYPAVTTTVDGGGVEKMPEGKYGISTLPTGPALWVNFTNINREPGYINPG